MARRPNYAAKLRKIAADLTELAAALESMPTGNGKSAPTRKRRSRKEAVALRKLLKAERKAGISVAELSAKHGVSKPYIYTLG